MQMIIRSILAFLIALTATPLTIRLAQRYNLVTDPDKRKHPAHTHLGVLPRGGGFPLYLGIMLPLLPFITNKIVFFILLGATLTTVVGLLDDKYDLSPYLRFGLNIAAALIAVVGGIGIPFITNPFDTVLHLDQWVLNFSLFGNELRILWVADLAAILWIVWCMNMVNWSKGVDGQLPGFVAVAALFLGILSLRFTRHDISTEIVTLMSFVTAFAFLGFLPWNFYPQRILPGYAAGSLAGYMLAVLAILSWGKLGTLMLVLALPMTDAVLVFFRRVLRKESPFRADRRHFHHSLLDMGWSRRRIAVFYWLVSLIVGFFSLWMNSEKKMFALFLFTFILSGMVIGSFNFAKYLKRQLTESII